jgi:hypothetical protein
MKKWLLVFVILLPVGICGQLTSHHYLDSSYTWFEEHGGMVFSGSYPCYTGGWYTYNERFHFIGLDTLAGVGWYKVHRDWQDALWCDFGVLAAMQVGTSGGVAFRMREDAQGRIWMRRNDSTIVMMYDYGAVSGVGDTLWMNDYLEGRVVDQIDTLAFGNYPRAKYWLECNNGSGEQLFVVEGVGANKGFDDFQLLCNTIFDNNYMLVCAQQSGGTLIIDQNSQCGVPQHNPTVGLDETQWDALHIYWRNEQQQMILQTDRLPRQFSWELVDVNGKRIDQGEGFKAQISFAPMARGIYLFVANSGTERKTVRFIKD